MPPVFKKEQVVCFYRPCQDACGRGPPLGEKNDLLKLCVVNRILLMQLF